MKTSLLLCAALFFGASVGKAAPNTSHSRPQRLHFARGATTLRVRGFLGDSQRRFYILNTRARQKLRFSAQAARGGQVVPLIKVTPPRGRYDGDKTSVYAAHFSRAGDYQIEVAANLMASNGRSGPFVLSISAR